MPLTMGVAVSIGLAAVPKGCDVGMSGGRSAPGGFFADADFDYEARIVLGAAAAGTGDAGLVLATLDRVTDGDPQSWFDAWTAVAAELAARGDDAAGRGHLATASWAFLAAAEYYAKALVFVDGLADQSVLLPTFREHRSCWTCCARARRTRSTPPWPGPAPILRWPGRWRSGASRTA
jgi:hypothetical protein